MKAISDIFNQERINEISRQVIGPGGPLTEKLKVLLPSEENWQPSDLLPDLSQDDWHDRIVEVRRASAGISDEILLILVGNLITEEALPSYQTFLNSHPVLLDETGVCDRPWDTWVRAWTGEENRHGDVLNRYLYLTGRLNFRAFEVTIQNLLRNGFDPQIENPYMGGIYTSFQERATRVSHGNTAKHVKKQGDPFLFKICNLIAADEARHESVYKFIVKQFFEIDPEGILLALEYMLRKTIVMPGNLMDDGNDKDLFKHFATIAQKTGIYTARDYADILEHLIDYWEIRDLKGLSGETARAQDKVCSLPQRYLKMADHIETRLKRQAPLPFSWIFNREV